MIAILLLQLAMTPVALDPPDILLVILDDVADVDLDSVDTPVIDGLAQSGTRFRRAFANPVCSPTRRSLLFGQWAGQEASRECGPVGPDDPPTGLVSIPEMLAPRGYTSALFGKWHLGSTLNAPWPSSAQAHGFDVWRAGIYSNVSRCNGQNYTRRVNVANGQANLVQVYHMGPLVNATVNWWNSTTGPRFAVLSFQNAHVPLHRPPAIYLPPGYPTPDSPTEKYHALIASMDFMLGQVLAQLDSEPWIILVGDNGTPALLEDKAKTTTFERGIRVPMVVSHQSLGVPRETLELVHVADIMATVAELAGTPLPNDPEVISESFLPQVYGRDPGRRSHVVCWTEDFDDRCVRMPRWKLRQVMGSEELYDLLRDPDEEDPIDPQHPRYRRFADALRELFPSW